MSVVRVLRYERGRGRGCGVLCAAGVCGVCIERIERARAANDERTARGVWREAAWV